MSQRAILSLAAALAAAAAFAGRPVARWDVVPGERVAEKLNVGVVAFHEKGASVAFTVDGRAAATVAAPKLNPQTGVVEHFFAFDPKGRKDGPVKIGAKVSAEGAPPYELPEIVLYADCGKTVGSHKTVWVDSVKGNDFATGTEAEPLRTIKQGVKRAGDGGTLLLKPGEYTAKLVGGGKNRSYWTLITTAPGVDRSAVKIQGGKTGTEMLCFRNVELICEVQFGHGFVLQGENGETSVWVDGCRMSSKNGREVGPVVPFAKYRAYVTGGETEDMTSGPNALLVRSHAIRRTSGTTFSGGGMLVVNCVVDDVDPSGSGSQPDFFRANPPFGEWVEDVIMYNVKVSGFKGRTFSFSRMRDGAFVGIDAATESTSLIHSQFMEGMENVVFAGVKAPTDLWQFIEIKRMRTNFVPKDVRMYGVKPLEFKGAETTDGSGGLLIAEEIPAGFPKGEK